MLLSHLSKSIIIYNRVVKQTLFIIGYFQSPECKKPGKHGCPNPRNEQIQVIMVVQLSEGINYGSFNLRNVTRLLIL